MGSGSVPPTTAPPPAEGEGEVEELAARAAEADRAAEFSRLGSSGGTFFGFAANGASRPLCTSCCCSAADRAVELRRTSTADAPFVVLARRIAADVGGGAADAVPVESDEGSAFAENQNARSRTMSSRLQEKDKGRKVRRVPWLRSYGGMANTVRVRITLFNAPLEVHVDLLQIVESYVQLFGPLF